MEFLKEARLGLLFLKFVKDPTDTKLIFKMSELGRSLRQNQTMISDLEAEVQKHLPFHQAWIEKWTPDLPDMEDLEKMPEGTLGHAYAQHLLKNNLKLNFYPQTNSERFVDYISCRLYISHDLWHVLLGYEVSPQGESEVQAFTLAQINSPTSVMLIAAGLLNLLKHNPASTPRIFSKCVDAYQRGKSAEFLLNYRFESLLTEPLEKIRSMIKV